LERSGGGLAEGLKTRTGKEMVLKLNWQLSIVKSTLWACIIPPLIVALAIMCFRPRSISWTDGRPSSKSPMNLIKAELEPEMLNLLNVIELMIVDG